MADVEPQEMGDVRRSALFGWQAWTGLYRSFGRGSYPSLLWRPTRKWASAAARRKFRLYHKKKTRENTWMSP